MGSNSRYSKMVEAGGVNLERSVVRRISKCICVRGIPGLVTILNSIPYWAAACAPIEAWPSTFSWMPSSWDCVAEL
jgi:hypothetical protein